MKQLTPDFFIGTAEVVSARISFVSKGYLLNAEECQRVDEAQEEHNKKRQKQMNESVSKFFKRKPKDTPAVWVKAPTFSLRIKKLGRSLFLLAEEYQEIIHEVIKDKELKEVWSVTLAIRNSKISPYETYETLYFDSEDGCLDYISLNFSEKIWVTLPDAYLGSNSF